MESTLDEPTPVKKPLPLPVVDFEKSTANLTPVAEWHLEQLAHFIVQNPSCKVELVINVEGNDDAVCYNLSLDRGRAIRDYLVLTGVDEEAVTISAYGNVNTKKHAAPAVAVRFREK